MAQQEPQLPWVYHAAPVLVQDQYFRLVKGMVDGEANKVFVYGKWHTERRLTGTYTRELPATFTYSNSTRYTTGEWPDVLQQLSLVAAASSPARADGTSVIADDYDLAHINYYRDGNDDLSWHWDKDGAGECIVSFSFYDPEEANQLRDFSIRRKTDHKDTHKLALDDGSMLVMYPQMQTDYEHSVPTRKRITRGRVNVTLRQHRLREKQAGAALNA